MIDRKLYQETFSRLKASQQAKQEVFEIMKQKRPGRRLRILRGAMIAAALTAALAITANAASNDLMFHTLRLIWSNGFESRLVDEENGVEMTIYTLDPAVLEDNGRLYLIVNSFEERIDITDALAEEGTFHWDGERDGVSVFVDVEGTLEDWTLTTGTEGGPVVYSYTRQEQDPVENGDGDGARNSQSAAQWAVEGALEDYALTAGLPSGEVEADGTCQSTTVIVRRDGP